MKSLSQSKRIFTLVAMAMILVLALSACQSAAATPTEEVEVPLPSKAGGPGAAIGLVGDATKGADVYKANCVTCHGEQGKGGVANPGSTDTTVPELNPIDPGLKSADAKVFATNIDLFIEHGSDPEGGSPTLAMLPFGDNGTLTPQQIADVIAYVISLNK